MNSLECFEEGDELRGEAFEGGDLGCEESVSAGGGLGEEEEGGDAWRL